jgi:molecular chaperone DnaJ
MSPHTNVSKSDYYEILGVDRNASDQELKTAYRKLAMQHHPDRNPDNPQAEDRFKEASEAYQVLSDSEKRAAYDRYGHAGVSSGFGGNPFAGGGVDVGDIFGDFFGEMFNMGGGSARRTSRVQRGQDLQIELVLEFEDAVFGKETEIRHRRLDVCQSCQGTGTNSGRGPSTCSQCHGRGQIRFQQGFFTVARTCSHCGGSGQMIADPCTVCRGDTLQARDHELKVKVPAGVEDGTRIRYSGEGDAGRFGGPRGDFYVLLQVKPHDYFERDGNDLHCVVPISFPQAALGDEIEIATLDGGVVLKIPEGTQSGREFHVRGKGVPYLNEHGRGDLIVQVRVQTPKKLNKQQRELVRQLSETMTVENTPTSRGLLEKMKDLFS